jgi:hypothetical protein
MTTEHKLLIGPRVLQVIAETKEIVEEQKRIVACEPPIIRTHDSSCLNADHCNDDWYAAWWNGMGRLILDGRNPLSFEEAFKRFEILKFGRMGEGCKKEMLKLVKAGFGFSHCDACVEAVGKRLVATIQEDT